MFLGEIGGEEATHALTFDRVALFFNMNLQFVLATHPTSVHPPVAPFRFI